MFRDRHPLCDRLLAEVDDVVAVARGRAPVKLDIERTAARLNVGIEQLHLGEHLLGLTLDDRRVLIHDGLVGAERSFVFAHEVAHVLRRRGYFPSVGRSAEEWFADWFARELVLPRRALRAYSEAQLAAWHVSFDTVALQFAALNQAPPIMRNGPRVLCRQCGTTDHHPGCQCGGWRRLSPRSRRLLPDARRAFMHLARVSSIRLHEQLEIYGLRQTIARSTLIAAQHAR
jgi:hypothetical protein